ncbi:MAG: nucleotidyl transferase AbiEii/AbiGii toxin family protein [Desulfobacterales bacterium]|nr:nucleotidyl transferase AbiEii/AbiGii toxin family protein [Desulfobacterales bacterium]MBF0398541.1 nucleotidyl transferase AbiEii/AbiGii toxin family protein [Desulfobacterales bacterium]
MDVLEIIHKYLSEIPYAIVGGGAVQIYTSSIAIKKKVIDSIKDINGLSFMFRKTGDIDLSFLYDLSELIKTFNMIIEQYSDVYKFHSFIKRFVIQKGNHRLNLNYQTEPNDLKGIRSYYDDIIHTAITVCLPYRNKIIEVKTAKPEYIVASKLTRIKPKDQIDIMILLKAVDMDNYPFDSEEVRSILKSVNKEDNYSILMDIMDSM